MDRVTQDRLKVGFDVAASAYAASRPGYPTAAVDWLLGESGGVVLDLAAGSGSLTGALADALAVRGGRVLAGELSANLLIELRRRYPDVAAVQTAAERLPFADASLDVVTVATAFHWFDAASAVPELARVLRPDGRLALTWNTREASTPVSHDLAALLRSARPASLQGRWGTASVAALDDGRWFERPEHAVFPHEQRLGRDGLIALAASRSYVIALAPSDRTDLLERVGAMFDRHVDDAGLVTLPYRCECWRARPIRVTLRVSIRH